MLCDEVICTLEDSYRRGLEQIEQLKRVIESRDLLYDCIETSKLFVARATEMAEAGRYLSKNLYALIKEEDSRSNK